MVVDDRARNAARNQVERSGNRAELAKCFGEGIAGYGVDEADFEGAMRGELFGGDEEFESSSLPDQARQTLRSSPTGDQT